MGSLRFPFWSSQSWKSNPHSFNGFSFSTAGVVGSVVAVVGAGIGLSLSSSHNATTQKDPLLQRALDSIFSNFGPHCSSPLWGSLSLADNSSEAMEPKTGVSFPSILNDTRRLLGIGLRKKSILGLKNIDVYAFGVYADESDIKISLKEKYGKLSVSALKENKEFQKDVLEEDINMTVRLQVVYGRLSIRSVRSAFEESVGSRIQKFGGSDNQELLQRFTSQFKDEYKIPKGSVIDLSRERGHVLCTKINGKEVGSIQSKLLCRSVLDLYVGEDPFDRQAKEEIDSKLASLVIE